MTNNGAAIIASELVRQAAPFCQDVQNANEADATTISHAPRPSCSNVTHITSSPSCHLRSTPNNNLGFVGRIESASRDTELSQTTASSNTLVQVPGTSRNSEPGFPESLSDSLSTENSRFHQHLSGEPGSEIKPQWAEFPLESSGFSSDLRDLLQNVNSPNVIEFHPESIPDMQSGLRSIFASRIISEKRLKRKTGLTLAELTACVATCKNEGRWIDLLHLIANVFGSYESLACSFQPADEVESASPSPSHAQPRDSVAPEMACLGAPPPKSAKASSLTSSASTSSALKFEDGSVTPYIKSMNLDEQIPIVDDSNTKSSPWTGLTTAVKPVHIVGVRKAYQAILGLQQKVDVVESLTRAVRHLLVANIRKLLVTDSPSFLQQVEPEQGSPGYYLQQSVVNIFIILYECPLVTDASYFESLLPSLCRATTWLPVPIQVKICRAWAKNTTIPGVLPQIPASSPSISSQLSTDDSPEDVPTTLVELQRILLQQVTLRCLTIEYGSAPNEDSQIREACIVLRIVYYASILAGQVDSEVQRLREKEENAEFNKLFLAHAVRGRAERVDFADPLSSALKLSACDCRKPLIPATEFINETLNDGLVLEKDLTLYHSNSRGKHVLSFMEVPFLLKTSTKAVQLYFDNRLRMNRERDTALLHTLLYTPQPLYLKVRITRERVVEDALQALEFACLENPRDLKKQLYIEFDGEQGIDEGGLSKEFFQLVIERIFNPDYGMFTFTDATQTYWFNPNPIDDMDREYCLIGIVLGLAIYNNIILDVHFPSVLYRKLVGKLGTFHDLKMADPSLGQGLQELLDYEEDDFCDVFDTDFVISYRDLFGNTITHELKPNSTQLRLTKDNRQEYVELYADFLLNSSIRRQFNAFRRGFQMVCDESPLTVLFTPREIESLVRGSRDYNFHELEKVTVYDGDYTPQTPVICNFWRVVHRMSEEQQKQMLKFVTGSDRITVGGMSKMKFVIARQGPDTEKLPTAHTCFNILLLPDYATEEKLERLLLKAITYSVGFGMF